MLFSVLSNVTATKNSWFVIEYRRTFVTAAPHFIHTASPFQPEAVPPSHVSHSLLFTSLFLSTFIFIHPPISSTLSLPLLPFYCLCTKHTTVSHMLAVLRRPADCGLFSFSAAGPVQSDRRLTATAPHCRIWQSFKTSPGMSVCVLCPWQQANRGCHERAGRRRRRRRRKENSNERRVMEGTEKEGGKLYVETCRVFGKD